MVLAMGKRGSPRRLGVPGEDLDKVSYGLIEAESYENRDILVVGGGDSAVEAALALSRAGRNRVTLSYRKDVFSRVRDRNLKSLENAEREGLVDVLRCSSLEEIQPETATLSTLEGMRTLANDFVFVFAGGVSPEGFLRRVGIEIVEKQVTA